MKTLLTFDISPAVSSLNREICLWCNNARCPEPPPRATPFAAGIVKRDTLGSSWTSVFDRAPRFSASGREKSLKSGRCARLARRRRGIRGGKRTRGEREKHSPDFIFSADSHNARGVPRFLARRGGHYEYAKQRKSISIIPDRVGCHRVASPGGGLIHSVSLYNAGAPTFASPSSPSLPPSCASDVVR